MSRRKKIRHITYNNVNTWRRRASVGAKCEVNQFARRCISLRRHVPPLPLKGVLFSKIKNKF